ncbi:beta-1,4-glucuronyltransferase 1 [Hyalella azteca]|uniref:Beta-1,4-glucuronyltransferase 1 n=1 Tax=Hyalella azteca TaxID=294128 RepID=A0A8B7PKU6_HYAAZ|nr:beta-1,4-glucuronyltransferase 1 [Hyalella azteca]XP_018026047.1 beta-1,4-glucuronyltransferase 1 [Hyalella azteca]
MNLRYCLKLAVVLLLLNVSAIIFMNIIFMLTTPSAVKEKYVTVGPPKSLLEDEYIAEGDYKETEDQTREKKLIKQFEIDLSTGLWDKSRVFKVHPFIIKSSKWDELRRWEVCMSSQCSADLLFWVVEQVKTWQGPVSIAVFAPDVDFIVAKLMIQYMRTCFPEVRERVSFHLVYPGIMPPVLNTSKLLEYDCQRHEDVNNELKNLFRTPELKKILGVSRYPQNLMRNTARHACQNTFSFTPDIDMLSIPSMSEQLNEFLARPNIANCHKCAFIIPTYEISIRAPANPTSKEELVKLRSKGLAQQFHIRVFKNNQANSNLSYWETVPSTDGSLNIAYNITTWKRHWEPIYVTNAKVPAFEERFIGYGFTRNSQVYEMRLAGYSWLMLDGAFLTHRGFQTKRTHTKTRRKQIAENSGRFNIFVRELYQRYHIQLKDEDAMSAFGQKTHTKTEDKKIENHQIENIFVRELNQRYHIQLGDYAE